MSEVTQAAEHLVLGAILIHGASGFSDAAELLGPSHFSTDANQRIFAALDALADREEAIDLVTLKNELERRGDLEAVGGPAYVAALVDGVPRSTDIAYYARIVKEKASLRRLIQAANGMIQRAQVAMTDGEAAIAEADGEA